MRRILTVLALLAVILAVGACGTNSADRSAAPGPQTSSNGESQPTATLPEEGIVDPGKYRTGDFVPAFSFAITQKSDIFQMQDVLFLFRAETDVEISFVRPEVVFDPDKPSEEVPKPPPESVDGWITWFQEHPNIDAGEPVPATIGGVSGKRIDVATSTIPGDYPEDCGGPCVPSFSASEKEGKFSFFAGYKERYYVLNVDGTVMLVGISIPDEEFDQLLPEAQKVVDTIEWEAES